MRSHRPRRRASAALTLVALFGAGCVKPGPPGVSITPLSADIVFGVKEPTSSPIAPTSQAAPLLIEDPEDFAKILEVPEATPLPTTKRPTTAAVDCPPAALTAFPKDPATVTLEGRTGEGVYRHKSVLSVTQAGRGTQTVTRFQTHAVRRVTPTAGKDYEFTYQLVEPDAVTPGEFIVTTYRVNDNPAIIRNVNQAPQTIGVVDVPGAEATITPPNDEPGIFMVSFERQAANGRVISGFEPAPAVKVLPLDEGIIKSGQNWHSTGIDPGTGNVMDVEGNVTRKTRVDACGEIVEGWLVDLTIASAFDGETFAERRLVNFATQYGGLIIGDSVSTNPAAVTIDTSLARLAPDPLPVALK